MTGIVDLGSRWYTRFVYEVEVPAVLHDVGICKTALRGETLHYTLPSVTQIGALRRRVRSHNGRQKSDRRNTIRTTFTIFLLSNNQRLPNNEAPFPIDTKWCTLIKINTIRLVACNLRHD